MFSMATDLPEENRMKALTLLDEMSQFHWLMLKSVLLILGMLPVAQGVLVSGSRLKAAAKSWWVSLQSVCSAHGRF